MENYIDLADLQIKTYYDAVLALQAHQLAKANRDKYPGWMYFKKVGPREYLFHALDRHNNGGTRGARSPETEAILSTWLAEQAAAEQASAVAAANLEQHKRLCLAVRLGRFNKTAAKILRLLDRAGVGANFIVIGTHALHAYEAMAGVHFISDLTATKDFDILWDSRMKLAFAALDGTDITGFMDILKKVDKTFTRSDERTFQALNASGFAVEVLRPLDPITPGLMTPTDGINPVHLRGLEFLLEPPLVSEIVIAEDGYPMQIQVPDPAAFVLHKLWVSKQIDRKADKARRDRSQALALANLIQDRIPQYAFEIGRIQNFPEPLLDQLDDTAFDT